MAVPELAAALALIMAGIFFFVLKRPGAGPLPEFKALASALAQLPGFSHPPERDRTASPQKLGTSLLAEAVRQALVQAEDAKRKEEQLISVPAGKGKVPRLSLDQKMEILFQEKAIERARRYQLQVAMLYLDLDGFKNVNDTFGHGMGDYPWAATGVRDTGPVHFELLPALYYSVDPGGNVLRSAGDSKGKRMVRTQAVPRGQACRRKEPIWIKPGIRPGMALGFERCAAGLDPNPMVLGAVLWTERCRYRRDAHPNREMVGRTQPALGNW